MRFFISQILKKSIGGQDMKILTEYLSILPSHIDIIWDFNFYWEEEEQLKLVVFNLKEL